jgi:hypothetical protein
MVKQVFQACPFHLFLSCICYAETLSCFDGIKKILRYSTVTLLKNPGLSNLSPGTLFYQHYQGNAAEFVLQPLKISSVQYRSSITGKNGPGGS